MASKRKREVAKSFSKNKTSRIEFIGKKLVRRSRNREPKKDYDLFRNFSDRMVS